MVLIAGAAFIPPISLARPVRPRSPVAFGVVVRDDAGMSSAPVEHMRTRWIGGYRPRVFFGSVTERARG
jgi:hypothetical protein